MKTPPIIFFALVFLLLAGTAFAEVTIIANHNVPETNISQKELKEIFLGKRIKWSDKSRINVVLNGDTGLSKSFFKNYVGRSLSQFNTHWRNMVFTGQGQMPLTLKSDQEVIRFVADTPGAVGYVGSLPESTDIKKLRVK